MEKNKNVQFVDLGKVDYKATWDFQESLLGHVSEIKLGNRKRSQEDQLNTPNFMLFCEHPHVYTLGKSGNEDHLLLQPAFLSQIGASYFKINRGGDITYHGPGQLVGYPILDLENFTTDIHLYLRNLEEVIIQSCLEFGLLAGRVDNLTGVWIDPDSSNKRKICAMGVKASRWITMHGFALNINTDLSYFQHIVPCGIMEYGVTSLEKELGYRVDEKRVKEVVLHHFKQLFETNIQHVSRETLEKLV
ncbi:MAG: Lipoyl(octanoyl) transferase [Bacteroidota bacterium]|jgi:lipoyl(octanoyl) transferase